MFERLTEGMSRGVYSHCAAEMFGYVCVVYTSIATHPHQSCPPLLPSSEPGDGQVLTDITVVWIAGWVFELIIPQVMIYHSVSSSMPR